MFNRLDPDDYVQDGETVYAQREAIRSSLQDSSGTGELTCTDTRVAFVAPRRVVDIDLTKIEVLEYRPWRPLRSIIVGIVTIIVAVFALEIASGVDEIPSEIGPLVAGLAFLFGTLFILIDIYYRYDTLAITAGGSSFTFKGKTLGSVPHAIRGAGRQ